MKNPFWFWRRLREGREIFRATTELKHADGTVVTVTVEGAHATYVSAVMNGIKAKYAGKSAPEKPDPRGEDPWKPFEEYLRKEKEYT